MSFVLLGTALILTWFAGFHFLAVPDEPFDTSSGAHSSEQPAQATDAAPSLESTLEPDSEADLRVVINETVQQGDTAGKILQPYLTVGEIQTLSDACTPFFDLRRLRQGKPYTLSVNAGIFESLEYEIDDEQKLVIELTNGNFATRIENIVYDVVMARITGEIKNHLFQAVSDAGETPLLAIGMADIFAWEINFIRDLRPGDSFTLIVEKRFRDGEFKGYGRIRGALFTNQGTTYEAFLFRDADGFPHYYTNTGESVKRAFLKAPLSFTRISSTFSPKRLHPILQVWRAHPGIDYAAPTGTPVKAIGNGTVTFKGWGKGAGNYIALSHNNRYESMYLHLSSFAKGLEKGKKVQQGEVIGFVGSTGYSTGPHLDFRMKKDGQYINPLNTVSPRTDPVNKNDLPEFKKLMDEMRAKLTSETEFASS